jgi:hypothetical protein
MRQPLILHLSALPEMARPIFPTRTLIAKAASVSYNILVTNQVPATIERLVVVNIRTLVFI